MSQCTTSVPAADQAAKPIQLVPKKSVLNSHGCGGDCTDPDFLNGRWPRAEVLALFNLPFNDLLWQAQQVHREHWDPNEIEHATLLSVKTGGCPEDCGYCPQSASYDTGVEASKLMSPEQVREAVVAARDAGAVVVGQHDHGLAVQRRAEHPLAADVHVVHVDEREHGPNPNLR